MRRSVLEEEGVDRRRLRGRAGPGSGVLSVAGARGRGGPPDGDARLPARSVAAGAAGNRTRGRSRRCRSVVAGRPGHGRPAGSLRTPAGRGRSPRRSGAVAPGRSGRRGFGNVRGSRCAVVSGFSVHANVCFPARDRMRLERLCRYAGRPAVATQRLSELPDGRLLYRLKRPWRDGTEAVIFEPRDFIAKLAALAPAPRAHLVRYHGVLGPAAGLETADRSRSRRRRSHTPTTAAASAGTARPGRTGPEGALCAPWPQLQVGGADEAPSHRRLFKKLRFSVIAYIQGTASRVVTMEDDRSRAAPAPSSRAMES
jgi:hypothetical protein